MKKPIIATKLVGVLVSEEPWEKAHILWFEDFAKKLERPDIADWGRIYTQKEDYFAKVDELMRLMYPDFDDERRTSKARELYFEYVLNYIDEHHEVIRNEVLERFSKLKEKYDIALISTSSKKIIDMLLDKTSLKNFFDYIEVAEIANKDKRDVIYSRFVFKYGEPVLYIESLDDLNKLNEL